MAFTIAVAGKGGTGKTTVSALLCRSLMSRSLKPLLAVDADPNSCLPEKLGVSVTSMQTIGFLREQLRSEPGTVPQGISKMEWIERLIHEDVTEAVGFDLVVMGRQEGPNCYCYINNLLRNCLAQIAGQYQAVVIDNEAGLEHLSRRMNGSVDVMLVIAQPTPSGAHTATRIRDIVASLQLDVKSMFLVLNRCNGSLPPSLLEEFQKTGQEILGYIPDDPLVTEREERRESLLTLPPASKAGGAVEMLVNSIVERRHT